MILVWKLWSAQCPYLVRSIVRCGYIAVAVGLFCTAWTALGKWFDRDGVSAACLAAVPRQVADRDAVCREAQEQADTLYVLLWVHFIAYAVAGALALAAMRRMGVLTGWWAVRCENKNTAAAAGCLKGLAGALYGLTAGTSLGVIVIMHQMGQARQQWGTVAVEAAVAYMALGDMLALWKLR